MNGRASFTCPQLEKVIPSCKLRLLYTSFTAQLSFIVSISEKLPEETTLRLLEDEGIFVGDPIEISQRNMRRLEHRIIMEKAL